MMLFESPLVYPRTYIAFLQNRKNTTKSSPKTADNAGM